MEENRPSSVYVASYIPLCESDFPFPQFPLLKLGAGAKSYVCSSAIRVGGYVPSALASTPRFNTVFWKGKTSPVLRSPITRTLKSFFSSRSHDCKIQRNSSLPVTARSVPSLFLRQLIDQNNSSSQYKYTKVDIFHSSVREHTSS